MKVSPNVQVNHKLKEEEKGDLGEMVSVNLKNGAKVVLNVRSIYSKFPF